MDIASMLPDELNTLMAVIGEKPFRAKQVFSWLHQKNVMSYDEMTNLSKPLREKLARDYPLCTVTEAERLVS